jgi:hypothetical protein
MLVWPRVGCADGGAGVGGDASGGPLGVRQSADAAALEGAVDVEMMQRLLLIQNEEAAFDSASKEGEDKLREFDDQVRACVGWSSVAAASTVAPGCFTYSPVRPVVPPVAD